MLARTLTSASLCLLLAAAGCEQQPAGGATAARPAANTPATSQPIESTSTDSQQQANTQQAGVESDLADTSALTFNIKTIHCEGCVQAIRVALTGIEGVKACDVSLEDQSAVVHVTDPAIVGQIVTAMADQGREATLVEPAADSQ